MNDLLFSHLVCPDCHSRFSVWDQESNSMTMVGDHLASKVKTGLLNCTNGHVYPIVNSIPRIFPDALRKAKDVTDDKHVPSEWRAAIISSQQASNAEFGANFSRTQKSFSEEWQALGEDESAWGQSVGDRLKLFTDSFKIEARDIDGKQVLDAGCGHGENALALASAGAKVFAIDLSYSVDIVARRVEKAGLGDALMIVQTNVARPPFRPGKFDLVYSAGVLHHTPDTHRSFSGIAPLSKLGGRTFIEVYSNEFKNLPELIIHYAFVAFRKFTLLLPFPLLHLLCWVLAIPLWIYIHAFNWIKGGTRYIPRSLSGAKLSLFDALSPRFDWHHTTDEVRAWFVQEGYTDLKRTYENHNCIGIVGTRAS